MCLHVYIYIYIYTHLDIHMYVQRERERERERARERERFVYHDQGLGGVPAASDYEKDVEAATVSTAGPLLRLWPPGGKLKNMMQQLTKKEQATETYSY